MKNITITHYDNIYQKEGLKYNLIDLFNDIKSSKYQKQVEKVQYAPDRMHTIDAKSKLPACCFSGYSEHRKTFPEYNSELLCLDFDNVDVNSRKVKIKRASLKSISYVVGAFVSPSGQGIKCLIKGKYSNKEEYNLIMDAAFWEFKEKYGLEADTSKLNYNDLCYVSHDTGAFVKEDAEYFPIEKHSKKEQLEHNGHKKVEHAIEFICPRLEEWVLELEKSNIDITENYNDWRNIGFALVSEYGEKGRSYFHRISSFYPRYSIAECNKKYSSFINSDGEGITIKSLYHIFNENKIRPREFSLDNIEFNLWGVDKGYYYAIAAKVFRYVEHIGIRRILPFKNSKDSEAQIIQIKDNKVSPVNITYIETSIFNYIKSLSSDQEIIDALLEPFLGSKPIFAKKNFNSLNLIQGEFIKDTVNQCYLFYNNGICKITQDLVKVIPFEENNKLIWDSQIQDRNLNLSIGEDCEFNQFIKNVSEINGEPNPERELEFRTIIGYIIHGYKDKANPKSIQFIDSEMSNDEENGGTGKSLIVDAISKIVNVLMEDGPNFSLSNNKFGFSQINLDTKVFCLNDVPKNFDFKKFFNLLTGDIPIEKKYANRFTMKFEDTPKVVITSNHVIIGDGDSHERRRCVVELAKHYSKNWTPMDEFDHRFFEEWNEDEWAKFDNYMIRCVKLFFTHGLKEPKEINVTSNYLSQVTSEEFVSFADKLDTNIRYDKKEQHELFLENVKHNGKIGQRKFTSWLKIYAKSRKYDFDTSRSDGDRYFTFIDE